jgi:hypothetical protein
MIVAGWMDSEDGVRMKDVLDVLPLFRLYVPRGVG